MITRKYTPNAELAKQEMLPGLKKHLRILVNDFDSSLDTLLEAAIADSEDQTGSIFLESEFTLDVVGLEVDKGGFYPIQSILSAEKDNISVIEDVITNEGRVKYVAPEEGNIIIVVKAGYPTIPPAARAAISLIAASLWSTPEDGVRTMPTASSNLLKTFRRWQM